MLIFQPLNYLSKWLSEMHFLKILHFPVVFGIHESFIHSARVCPTKERKYIKKTYGAGESEGFSRNSHLFPSSLASYFRVPFLISCHPYCLRAWNRLLLTSFYLRSTGSGKVQNPHNTSTYQSPRISSVIL